MPTSPTHAAPALHATTQDNLQKLAMRATIALLATVFVAVCAHIALPLGFSPVPLTLQTFAVMLIGMVFGPALGGATLALYLAEGLCGLPVFSPAGPGGLAQLMGLTGGYLFSYPIAAAMAGTITQKLRHRMPGLAACIIAGICAASFILAMGASWLGVITHISVSRAAAMGIVPFLPGEGLKVAAAAGIATTWMRLRKHA